jgi:DNA-binding GntR family transcriptional regulator
MTHDGSEPTEVPGTTERVAEVLRERMLEGELRPGTALREVAIARELDVSRNTLREGLRQLASEGVVVLAPNKGASVKRLSVPEVRDIYRVRKVIETQAATESAVADDERFADMEAAVIAGERAEQARSWRAVGTASLRFHQALVAVLGSELLNAFFRAVLAQLRLAWEESCDKQSFQRSWSARDRELYELFRQGHRSQGVGALLVYLEDSERQVIDELRKGHAAREANAARQATRDDAVETRNEE